MLKPLALIPNCNNPLHEYQPLALIERANHHWVSSFNMSRFHSSVYTRFVRLSTNLIFLWLGSTFHICKWNSNYVRNVKLLITTSTYNLGKLISKCKVKTSECNFGSRFNWHPFISSNMKTCSKLSSWCGFYSYGIPRIFTLETKRIVWPLCVGICQKSIGFIDSHHEGYMNDRGFASAYSIHFELGINHNFLEQQKVIHHSIIL